MVYHIAIEYEQKYTYDSAVNFTLYKFSRADTSCTNIRRWRPLGAYRAYARYWRSTAWILDVQINASSARSTCMVDP